MLHDDRADAPRAAADARHPGSDAPSAPPPASPSGSGYLVGREQEIADFLEHAVVGLHWVDAEGRILWANRAELDLLGYTADEYIGHHIAEFHADPNAIADILTRLSRNEELCNYEAPLRCKDGSIRHVLINSNVLWDGERFVHTRCFTQDVTDRKLAAEAQARLAAIVESADDAIFGKTLDGIITSWNPGAERLYGYTPAEIVGQSVARLVPPDRPDELPGIMARLRRGERVHHYETVRVCKDGRRVDVSVSISPIKDSRGVVVAAATIARDISEAKRLEAERTSLLTREQEARRAAEEALRLRDEFQSIASHELRTPLTLLKGTAQVLLRQHGRGDPMEPARLAQALRRIEAATTRLAELTDELLDVARLRTSQFAVRPRPTDLVPLIEDLAALFGEGLDARHTVTLDCPVASCIVQADPDRVRQVVMNLLQNATKYSPEGGAIQLSVEPGPTEVVVRVRDRGIGLPTGAPEAIFQPFGRAANATALQIPGLGLGLYICRLLLEQQGGRIWAESPGEAQGSTFAFTLPYPA
jgi:PAS domain S-box-containing protein